MSKFGISAAVLDFKNSEREKLEENKLTYLNVSDIEENPANSLIYDDFRNTPAFENLCESIKQEGILQPLLVALSPTNFNKFILIAGHRRLAAAMTIGLEKVPAMVANARKKDKIDLDIALISTNFLVRNKTPGEKAREIAELEDLIKKKRKLDSSYKGVKTREVLADITGMSERQIADYQKINRNLTAENKEKLEQGKISLREATDLASKKKIKTKKLNCEICSRLKSDDIVCSVVDGYEFKCTWRYCPLCGKKLT